MRFRNNRGLWQKVKYYPLRASLVLLGFFLLFFATQVHAFSYASADISTNNVTLQQGTELPILLNIQIQSNELIPFSFETDSPSFLKVDGELHSILRENSFSRNMRIQANSNAPAGYYFVVIKTKAKMNGTEYVFETPVQVHIVEKSGTEYFTSENTNQVPKISNVWFSAGKITLSRNSTAQLQVSFVHEGSATDYEIRFLENPLFLNARILNSAHQKVQPDESVITIIEFSTKTNTPFGNYPVTLLARNTVSNETKVLGTVEINVEKMENLELFLPNTSFEVFQNEKVQTSLTIQNTEWSKADVFIQTSSPFVEVGNKQIVLLPKSSVTIPVTLLPRSGLETVQESIYLVSPTIAESVSFEVKTMPAKEISMEEFEKIEVTVLNDSEEEWEQVSLALENVPENILVDFPNEILSLHPGESKELVLFVSNPGEKERGSFDLLVLNKKELVKTITVGAGRDRAGLNVFSGLIGFFSNPAIGSAVAVLLLLLVLSSRLRKKVYKVISSPFAVRKQKMVKEENPGQILDFKPPADEKEEKLIQKETK
jgi:hypothetical protein